MFYPCTCTECGKKNNYDFPTGVNNRGQITPPAAGNYPIKCKDCKQVFNVQVTITIEPIKPKEKKTKTTQKQ